jgi:2-hydroxy-3-oxopropionate reductase
MEGTAVTRIGFVGLGIMGEPMARNLLAAGHPLVVHTRTAAKAEGLVAEGAELAASPREVAQHSDVVILMLPDSPDVEAVVLGPDGVAEGAEPGMLLIDMSSIAPATARLVHAELAAKGVDALDAPVSGGEAAAVSGQLSIMVGGDEAALERARPIFEVLGKATTHIGPSGAGQVAKAANQVVVGLTIQAVSEALALAHAAGVDPKRVREALLGGFAQSKILEVHGERMLQGTFAPGFKLMLHRKDLDIALQTARATGVPLVATAQAAEIMNALIGAGEGGSDHSVLSKFYGRALDQPPEGA